MSHFPHKSATMKSFLTFCLFSGILLSYVMIRDVGGQWFNDASISFKNITFDMANRGSYNDSECLGDLMRCLEATKVDLLCHDGHWYTSICFVMRKFCGLGYGDMDGYSQAFNLGQSLCYKSKDQEWT